MSAADGLVQAYYSQIELHAGDGGTVHVGDEQGLVYAVEEEYVVLSTARQHGTLRVATAVCDAAPPLDPAWDTVVELSMRSGTGAQVTGWAGDGAVPIEVASGVDLRVRYVVVDGQRGAEQFCTQWDEPPLERYLLQLWSATPEPVRLVAATVPWSQYWAFGPEAVEVVASLDVVPDPDRLVAVVDAALARHPDVARHVRDGDERYRLGVIRYAQELFRVTYASDAYTQERGDHEGLARLIDARAALC